MDESPISCHGGVVEGNSIRCSKLGVMTSTPIQVRITIHNNKKLKLLNSY